MQNFIKRNTKRYYSALFALLTALIVLSGVAFYQIRKADLIHEKYVELAAISDLKINQIYYWREDKIGDAEILAPANHDCQPIVSLHRDERGFVLAQLPKSKFDPKF